MTAIGLAGGGSAVAANLAAARIDDALIGFGAVLALGAIELRATFRDRPHEGTLQVARDGRASWIASRSGASCKSSTATPTNAFTTFEPQHWLHAFGIVWITGQSGANAVRFAVTRDSIDPRDWAALRRWLRWLGRGGG